MHIDRRKIVLACVALAACSGEQAKTDAPDGASTPAATDPSTVIRPLYDRYLTEGATFPPLQEQAPWSNSLRGLLAAMVQRSQQINEPILDFDPLINAQDYQLSNLSVANEAIADGSHAVVRVTFINATTPTDIVYDLIWEDDGWKVDNIRGEGWDLRQIVAAPGANAASP